MAPPGPPTAWRGQGIEAVNESVIKILADCPLAFVWLSLASHSDSSDSRILTLCLQVPVLVSSVSQT
jgi:hypothetical protein